MHAITETPVYSVVDCTEVEVVVEGTVVVLDGIMATAEVVFDILNWLVESIFITDCVKLSEPIVTAFGVDVVSIFIEPLLIAACDEITVIETKDELL